MTPKEALIQAFGEETISSIDNIGEIEQACMNEATGDFLRENLVAHKHIIKGTTYSVKEYINATRFATLVNAGASDIDAFQAIFPDRYKNLTAKGKSSTNISSGIRSYKRSRLVQKVLEQIRVPIYLLMSDKRVDALLTLHEIMRDEDVHSRDRVAAATALATQLAPPKEALHKVEITDNRSENVIDALERRLSKYATQQQNSIRANESNIVNIGQTKLLEHNDD